MTDPLEALSRIRSAFDNADEVLGEFAGSYSDLRFKHGDDPVTDVDEALDAALHEALNPRRGEGWLSEETIDDVSRLGCSRVWIVDPLDGTREFVAGIPEWCISIALAIDGQPVVGGIYNPATGMRILGAVGHGVTVDGIIRRREPRSMLPGALVLASRSEAKRGEWDPFFPTVISVRTMGSVAFKTGLVGAGEADATFTLTPKNEWDVAAGAAIVRAAGGICSFPDGSGVVFNNRDPLLSGFLAADEGLHADLVELIAETMAPQSKG